MQCIVVTITGSAEGDTTGYGTASFRKRNPPHSTRRRKCRASSRAQSRPADVYVENWIDGGKVAFDISVVSPTQNAIILRAAETPAAAIEMRKSSKIREHFNDCRAQGIAFKPLVVESFGGWDADAVKLLKKLGRHSARRWGKNDALEIKYFFQRLSVALQRGNAALLVDRDIAA